MKNINQQKIQELRKRAIEATKHSHSPYSKYRVGASILTANNNIFSGCNIENSSFGATVCAERVAIWNAVSSGYTKFKAIYLYTKDGWPPCGMCRQVMSEFCDKDFIVIIGDQDSEVKTSLFEELFPLAFDSDKLDIK